MAARQNACSPWRIPQFSLIQRPLWPEKQKGGQVSDSEVLIKGIQNDGGAMTSSKLASSGLKRTVPTSTKVPGKGAAKRDKPRPSEPVLKLAETLPIR